MRYKKICLVIFWWILGGATIAQPVVHVDERFELTSIAFRLTGLDVCVHSVPENYVADIDSYFLKYKDHEFIKFLINVLDSKPSFDFSLLADLSGDIAIINGRITNNDSWVTNLYSTEYGQNPEDWTKKELQEYIRLLNKFYKDTRFHTFFEQHQNFYRIAEKRMQSLVNQIDTNWFKDFFGTPFNLDNIWVVPANGKHNFSLTRTSSDGITHNNCVIGCASTDSLGDVIFNNATFRVLIHEICHNYNNPICDKYREQYLGICDSLYCYIGDKLNSNYYNQISILYEGMNRLCEYSYYKANHTLDTEEFRLRTVCQGYFVGFVWLKEMLDYMNAFYENRDIFPTYEDFFPQLIKFLRIAYNQMEDYYLPQFDLLQPRVTSTFPSSGDMVDTTITKIIITFSKPMQTGCSWIRGIDNDTTIRTIPGDFEQIYWKDEYTYVVPLKEPLQRHTKYGFLVPENFPADKINYFGAKSYDLIFETK